MKVNDGTTDSGTQDVTFTITGTNDAPVLRDTTDPAAVLELSTAAAQDLAAISGSFAVSDLDVGDTLTASVVGSPTVLLNGSPFALPAGAAALTAAGAFTLTGATSNGGSTSSATATTRRREPGLPARGREPDDHLHGEVNDGTTTRARRT